MLGNKFYWSHTPVNFIEHDKVNETKIPTIKKKRGRPRKIKKEEQSK